MFDLQHKERYAGAVIDCSDDPGKTEQSHKAEVDINAIIKKHGIDMIAKTSKVIQLKYDDNPDNDFQETMNMLIKANQSFESLPSQIRRRFANDPAQFMDFVHNKDNQEEMYNMGLADRPEPEEESNPIEVTIVNEGVTPSEE